jgi:hypothetical protein
MVLIFGDTAPNLLRLKLFQLIKHPKTIGVFLRKILDARVGYIFAVMHTFVEVIFYFFKRATSSAQRNQL